MLKLRQTEDDMKKLIIVMIMILSIFTIVGLCACDKEQMPSPEYYSVEDFLNLKNFTTTNSMEKSTTCKYVAEDNKILFESDSKSQEFGDNIVYYSFDTTQSKIYTGGKWQSIGKDDVDDYLSSIEDRTGLVYNNLQSTYFEEKEKRVYTIQNDHFFKELFRQKYEKYFGKEYEENDFITEYETQKEELFGDTDSYKIILDCSEKYIIKLSIEKPTEDGREYTSYTYTDIDKTKISLPE